MTDTDERRRDTTVPSAPLDRLTEALAAADRGDRDEAAQLAAEVLRHDPFNREAQRLVRDVHPPPCELRRLTVLFCDLVGSTSMSTSRDPLSYGRLLERYHENCAQVITDHGGHVTRRLGDGVLALFGHPLPLGDDTRRAVRAGIALIDRFADEEPSDRQRASSERLDVRVAIHHGALHLDLVDSEIYGYVPNLAARLQEAAAVNSVVISDEVDELVGRFFETTSNPPVSVKGIIQPIPFHTVTRELEPTRVAPRRLTRLIARGDELTRLRDLMGIGDRSRSNIVRAGPAVLVRGDVGIGRTRLLREVLDEAEGCGFDVRAIVCSSADSEVPLGVASRLLQIGSETATATSPEERLSALAADVRRLGLEPEEDLSLLAPLLGIDSLSGFEPADIGLTKLGDRVLEALRRWVIGLARLSESSGGRGLLIGVDDLHLADRSSRLFFSGVATSPIAGVSLVATARSGTSVDTRGFETVDLEPLHETDAASLLGELDPALDSEIEAEILRRSGGVPWYLEELVKDARRDLDLGPIPGPLPAMQPVPDALYEPLLARLYSPAVDIGLVQAAAVIGSTFTAEILERMVRRSPALLRDGIDTLVDEGIIAPMPGGNHRFTHDLLREVAYELQPDDERKDAHGLVADLLEDARHAGRQIPHVVVARHRHMAGRIGAAVDSYELAAAEALDRGAVDHARTHLTTAIDLLPDIDDERSDLRFEAALRLKRAFLSVLVGGNADPRAKADYEVCRQLAADVPSGESVDTLVALWGYHAARGDMVKATELLDAIDETGVTADPVARAENDAGRGIVDFFRGRFVDAESRLAAAVAAFADFGAESAPKSRWQFPNDPAVWTHTWLAASAWLLGDPDRFGEQAALARRRAAALPFPHGPFSACQAMYVEAGVWAEMGDVEQSLQLADQVAALSERHGFDFWSLAAETNRAMAMTRDRPGHEPPDRRATLDHIEQFTRSELVATVGDTRIFVPSTLTMKATLHFALDEHDRAFELFDSAEAIAIETGCEFYLAEVRRHRGRSLCALGDPRGMDALRSAVATADRQGAVTFRLRALTDLDHVDGLTEAESESLVELRSRPGVVTAAGPQVPLTRR